MSSKEVDMRRTRHAYAKLIPQREVVRLITNLNGIVGNANGGKAEVECWALLLTSTRYTRAMTRAEKLAFGLEKPVATEAIHDISGLMEGFLFGSDKPIFRYPLRCEADDYELEQKPKAAPKPAKEKDDANSKVGIAALAELIDRQLDALSGQRVTFRDGTAFRFRLASPKTQDFKSRHEAIKALRESW